MHFLNYDKHMVNKKKISKMWSHISLCFFFSAWNGCAVISLHSNTNPHVKRYENRESGLRPVHDVTLWEPVYENWTEEICSLQLSSRRGRKELRVARVNVALEINLSTKELNEIWTKMLRCKTKQSLALGPPFLDYETLL